jgi:hypothetical protein
MVYDYQLGLHRSQIAGAKPSGPVWLRRFIADDFLTDVARLFLGHTQVADTGLEHLEGLGQLQWLSLRGTQVTDEGVKKLQQALPNCKIDH